MDTGVRPPGPVDPPDDSVVEARERDLEDPLDRPFPRLGLEPGEVRPVVFDLCAITNRCTVSGALA